MLFVLLVEVVLLSNCWTITGELGFITAIVFDICPNLGGDTESTSSEVLVENK